VVGGVMQGNRKSIKFFEKFCKKDVKKEESEVLRRGG
jgi:hypothetical protein